MSSSGELGDPGDVAASIRAAMRQDLDAIARMRMPFGRFGPEYYPPEGVPIYDLPAEYLEWFAQKGWPKGRLGELLRIVHQMKVDGLDLVFDEFRKRRGGRTQLRADRAKPWKT